MIDWKFCLSKRIAKEVSIDEGLISSLLESSKNKFISQKNLVLNKVTCNSKISSRHSPTNSQLRGALLSFGQLVKTFSFEM